MLTINELQTGPVFFILVGMLGLIIGSFLNVVIYRLPIMLRNDLESECTELITNIPTSIKKPFNLCVPRSHCPECKHLVTIASNIPILSFIWQKGKCKYCGAKISWRYPLVELLSFIATLFIALHFGASIQTAIALVLTWALIAVIFIDLEHQIIPDNLSIGLIWLGLIANTLHVFTTPQMAIVGATSAYLSLWLIAYGFKLVRKIEGMGNGDFKLFAAFGACFGWQPLPLIILIASLLALIAGLILIACKKHRFNQPMPFGPYLAIAGWSYLIWGQHLTLWLIK